jgi:hypothetical protein
MYDRAVRIIDGSMTADEQFRRFNVRVFLDKTSVEQLVGGEDIFDPFRRVESGNLYNVVL